MRHVSTQPEANAGKRVPGGCREQRPPAGLVNVGQEKHQFFMEVKP